MTVIVKLPSYSYSDGHNYSRTLIEKGEAFEARGDLSSAVSFYSPVARVDQIIELNRVGLAAPAVKAYERLAVISDAQGHQDQASLFAYLSRHLDEQNRSIGNVPDQTWRLFSPSTIDVLAIQVSALALFFFSGSALACGIYIIYRWASSRPLKTNLVGGVGVFSAAAILISAWTLYVSYVPYAQMFDSFLNGGSFSRLQSIEAFARIRYPVLLGLVGIRVNVVRMYAWSCVIVLCLVALLVIALRHIRLRRVPQTV